MSCKVKAAISDLSSLVSMLECERKAMPKQPRHRCRVCGQLGHRQETCTTYAGRLIRELQEKVQRHARAEPQRRLRRLRKDGESKVSARLQYSGARKRKQQPCVKRADIESEREILKDEDKCYQELLKAGVMERPKTCSHCKSDQVKPSNTKRGTKAGLRFISCAKCHRYTNYVWFSPFRHCRTTPAEIYEFLAVYSRQSMLQRPTATDLNRILGWGRRKLGNMIDVCLKSESLLGFANNRKRILKNDTEVDVHALKRFYVSGRNPHFQHLQKI